ncbi:MAG: histidine phosphatase family protein [Cytophagaceae bacterium]|nr:histidine phosphatase family protein [Cytophagaceae bacterium]MDW8456774.1 histidine phosphatase family protein [Cytophagaceae bacterium]
MKSLIFMRHAKSDWSMPGQKDFDRDLNSRGNTDAPKMGRKLFEMNVKPDAIYSSPALRAKRTAEYVAEQLKYDPEKIIFVEDIYDASTRTLLMVVHSLNDEYHNVMLFGHNPSLTYLAEAITKEAIGNIPTAGAVCMEFQIHSWKEVGEGNGNLKWFIYPKML